MGPDLRQSSDLGTPGTATTNLPLYNCSTISPQRKRGRPPFSQNFQGKRAPKKRATEAKPESEENNKINDGKKSSTERWKIKRYDAAATNLAKVLRENKGYHDNPMPRSKLRDVAKKMIGDTGLLDHLLKHLADQVIPPNNMERLRRRRDDKGMMEYWLESADLVDIREKAGVVDTFWVPPPGWKLGDTIVVCDCHCHNEVKVLNKKVRSMESEMEKLKKAKDEAEQPTAMVTSDNANCSGSVSTNNMSKKETREALMKERVRLQEQLKRIELQLVDLQEEGEALNMSEYKKEAVATPEFAASDKSSKIQIKEKARGIGSSTLELKRCSRLDDQKDDTWLSEMDQSRFDVVCRSMYNCVVN